MKPEIKYREPDVDHITIVVNNVSHVLTTAEYIDIIKPANKVEGSGSDYIIARNKILQEYFINGPKEQFSW